MSDDDWIDEDWTDQADEELDEEKAVRCPECGAEVYLIAQKCTHCGYWLTDEDQQAMRGGLSERLGLRIAVKVTLFALLALFLFVLSGFVLFG